MRDDETEVRGAVVDPRHGMGASVVAARTLSRRRDGWMAAPLLQAVQSMALGLALALAGVAGAPIAPAHSAGLDASPIRDRHIGASRVKAASLPRSEGDQAIVDGWPLYRSERGQAAFNAAMATLQATDGASPAAAAFAGCTDLECPLSLPQIGDDGWIPSGRVWVSPTDYVLIVHSPRLADGQRYRRRSSREMRYFVFHEFLNSSRNVDPYDTISSHSGSVFVPLYMSKQARDARGRHFVVVVQVAPYDVLSIHATNYGSAGAGMEVAKNPGDALEPLQGLAGIVIASIVKSRAPQLKIVNHHGPEGQPMLAMYERRLALLGGRQGAVAVRLPFTPAPARQVAIATAGLDDLVLKRGASPRLTLAERTIVPPRKALAVPGEARAAADAGSRGDQGAAAATPAPAGLSPLAMYLRANLAVMRSMPAYAGIFPEQVAAVAEDRTMPGLVFLLDHEQKILGRVTPEAGRGGIAPGRYVFLPEQGGSGAGRPFTIDIAHPIAQRSAGLTTADAEPRLIGPVRPAVRPLRGSQN